MVFSLYRMSRLCSLLIFGATVLCLILALVSCHGDSLPSIDQRPNFLVIVADDLAYSDLGCFGSEIRTPHIDQLAKEGLLFTQFHAAPQCAPSRAMLISGTDNHMAGVGRQDVPRESKWYGKRGYERNLSDRIIPFPELLQDAGYFTCLSGKWHLGYDSLSWPDQKGFTRSFGQLNGGSNHFLGWGLGVEGHDTVSEWVADGQRVLYPDGRYSTELHTDNILSYIKESKSSGDQPFFALAAYSSPHWPLQVPDEWLNRCAGRYDEGYEVLRESRLAALKKLGFVADSIVLPPYYVDVPSWESLTEAEQRVSARKMELYAAMVENLDYHVGRLRQELERMGEWENTFVVFLSDNGGAHRDFYAHPTRGKFIRSRYDNSLANMGKPTSFVSYGPAWAQSCMVPYKHHKTSTAEGGMIVPAIVVGKGVSSIRPYHGYANIMDIAPTLLDLANVNYDSIYERRKIPPMRGKTMTSLINGAVGLHSDEEVFALEFNGSIFLQKGAWKLVNYRKPYRADNFELYEMVSDPAEQYDLRLHHPEVYLEMLNLWEEYRAQNQILMQDDVDAAKYNY